MPDHIRLLGDEVEAAKWVGYARGRGNGSLTSPASGVVVRANKVGSMNLLTISAEGGAFLWVIGFDAGVFSATGVKIDKVDFSALGREKKREKFIYSNPYAGLVSRFVKAWKEKILTEGVNGNGGVYGITKSSYFRQQIDKLTGHATGYIEERTFSEVQKSLFWISEQPPSGSIFIEPTAIGVYKGDTYIIGGNAQGTTIYPVPYVYRAISGDVPTAQTYLYTALVAYPFTYQSPLPLTYPGGASVGCGPNFWAAYSWDKTTPGSGFLNVYDYPTGSVLYTWSPSAAQSAILQNMTNRYNQPTPLTVGSKYIAGLTTEFDPNDLDIVTSSHLFVWEVGKKNISLVSETQIAQILNPRGLSFDMRAAYEGKI